MSALRITLIYIVICTTYILASDLIVLKLFSSAEQITSIQTYKGIFFVLGSGLVIFLLVKSSLQKLTKANEELTTISRYHQLIFDKCPLPAFLVNAFTFQYLRVNDAALFKTGISRDRFLKSSLFDFATELDPEYLSRATSHAGKSGYMEVNMTLRDVENRPCSYQAFCQVIEFEKSHAIFFIAIDLSMTKELDARIIDSLIEKLEDERRRVSSEIHDSLTQYFGMANGITKSIKKALESQSGGINIEEGIDRLIQLTANGIRDSRSMSHALSPPTHGDIADLIQNLIDNLNYLKNIEFFFTASVSHTFKEEVTLNMYRIVQESVRNIINHSEATQANIGLFENSGYLILDISDNGKGFDMAFTAKSIGSLGLKSMRTRASKLGGSLSIKSAVNAGTEIHVKVPIEPNLVTTPSLS